MHISGISLKNSHIESNVNLSQSKTLTIAMTVCANLIEACRPFALALFADRAFASVFANAWLCFGQHIMPE